MCCRRRGQQRAYRGPLVVVLGKMAYDKYQQRKAQKSIADAQVRELPSPEVRSSLANDEIMEKANINPPSYDEIVVNRAMIPDTNVNFDEKAFDWTMANGAVDEIANSFEEDRGYAVADGMAPPNMPVNYQPPHKTGCQSGCHTGCRSGCRSSCRSQCRSGCGRGCHSGCRTGCQSRCYQAPRQGGCQSRGQQKKAERAGRRAEEAAAKMAVQ